MSEQDLFFIANPRSAAGALGKRWNALSALVRSELGTFASRLTEGPGHATEITREALRSGRSEIVAVGGDGTINEVLNGFFEAGQPIRQDAVLSVLPFGTGGDFRRTLGIPRGMRAAVRALERGVCRPIDVGTVRCLAPNGDPVVRHFINIAGFGLSGEVDHWVNQHSKRLGGKASFAWATMRAVREFRPRAITLRFDDSEPVQAGLHNVAVANGKYFGGGMRIAPDARLDDGFFDAVILAALSLRKLLTRGYRVYRGTHESLPEVEIRRVKRLHAEPVDETAVVRVDVDGENIGQLPATFEIRERAITLKLPCSPT